MKHCEVTQFLFGVMAYVLAFNLSSRAGDSDWLSEYVKTTTTETVDRDTEGGVTGRTVVTDTTVEMRRKVTEVVRVDTNGIDHIVSRRTDSYDSLSARAVPIRSVIEEPETEGGHLVTTSATTVTRLPNGQITTYEERDSDLARLAITKRVTSLVNKHGEKVVTTEVPDKYGNLVVTKTTITSNR